MRCKIFASLLILVISTQVFSLVTWTSVAIEYAKGNGTSKNIAILIMDEEIEEEDIKIQNCKYLAEYSLHYIATEILINKEVLYIHQSETLKEGFKSIPYNPPNC